MGKHRTWLVSTIAAVAALLVGVGLAFAQGVDPASYSTTLAPGDTVLIEKTVHTPGIPPKVDIVFLADTTGSMGAALANVQANAASILSSVRLAQPDSQFGAASYKDFGCDSFPFSVDQAVTASTTDAVNGINTWSAFGGCDIPEAQLNALYELANGAAGFRTSSTRVIVWFGDASGHDPSNGHTLTDVTDLLKAANIVVIAIPVDTGIGDGLDGANQATDIADATSGQVMPAADPDEVADAILAGLGSLSVTVTPVATCDTGLSATFDPTPNRTVTSGDDAVFDETLTVASNAPGGAKLQCTVDFLLNGVSTPGFQQQVSIDVPGTGNQDPACTGLKAGPQPWPPNHKFVLVTVRGATDPDADPLTYTVTGVTQDEPLNGQADGNTDRDARPAADAGQVWLRAERAGTRNGRVYGIHTTVTDGLGGSCTGIASVGVPHDRGAYDVAIDSGQSFVDF